MNCWITYLSDCNVQCFEQRKLDEIEGQSGLDELQNIFKFELFSHKPGGKRELFLINFKN